MELIMDAIGLGKYPKDRIEKVAAMIKEHVPLPVLRIRVFEHRSEFGPVLIFETTMDAQDVKNAPTPELTHNLLFRQGNTFGVVPVNKAAKRQADEIGHDDVVARKIEAFKQAVTRNVEAVCSVIPTMDRAGQTEQIGQEDYPHTQVAFAVDENGVGN